MRRTGLSLLVAVLFAAQTVHAQDDSEVAEDAESASSSGDAESAAEHASSSEAPAPTTPPTWWFGAYLQGAFVPSFMLQLFLDEAPTVANVGFGFTATHRTADGMSLVLGLGYAGYGFDGGYRAKGDPELDTEYLQSTLGLLHLRAQVLWSTDIVKDRLSFEYGVGLDFGVVLGSLTRTEAYRDAAGVYAPCAGPLDPRGGAFCELPVTPLARTDAYDQDGAHYGVVEKRVPPVMAIPMLPALALRYTPIRELAIKLDAAFGLMQFSIGLSAAYGVNL